MQAGTDTNYLERLAVATLLADEPNLHGNGQMMATSQKPYEVRRLYLCSTRMCWENIC
jgi:hypothetical protein